jgi:hypothetical protein
MTEPAHTLRYESRWFPALAILVVLGLLAVLPHHVQGLPVWVAHLAALAVLVAMAAVMLTPAHTLWRRIERLLIILLAAAYVANTILELVDLIGVITLHPAKSNAFSLLSSSVAIWVANMLTFSLLYWQIDGGGPYARAHPGRGQPDWLFPQAAPPEDGAPAWRPLFLDYLFLGYTTATAFSPTDAVPLTHRAKLLMLLESLISLLTLVMVVARAVNVLPS